MKKIYITSIFLVLLLTGCSSNDTNNYVGGNLKSDENAIINSTLDNNTAPETAPTPEASKISIPPEAPKEPKIEMIGDFSTKIYDKNSERQNNVEITCSKINQYVVKAGDTFSFCDTVGKATPKEGYEKAKIFEKDGDVTEGYGGGNCQVSTTLFNAVRNLDGIEILERHDHSNKVPYATAGNDAAVAYGGYDFKFVNNNSFDIKINSTTDGNYVTVTIDKIS